MDVRRREMASAVASFLGEAGHLLTTSNRYSRKRISDRAGLLAGTVTITFFSSTSLRNT